MATVHPGKGRLPDGQIFHAAGPSAGGWMIVAVHESKESWERFPGRRPRAPDAARNRGRVPDTTPGNNLRRTQTRAVAARVPLRALALGSSQGASRHGERGVGRPADAMGGRRPGNGLHAYPSPVESHHVRPWCHHERLSPSARGRAERPDLREPAAGAARPPAPARAIALTRARRAGAPQYRPGTAAGTTRGM